MYQPKEPITSAAEIKAIVGPILPNQIAKVIDHIDAHCRAWIERSPFIVVSSINAAGAMDISPKGDPPGFVKVLDRHTLAIPDRLGNHRGYVSQRPRKSKCCYHFHRTETARSCSRERDGVARKRPRATR